MNRSRKSASVFTAIFAAAMLAFALQTVSAQSLLDGAKDLLGATLGGGSKKSEGQSNEGQGSEGSGGVGALGGLLGGSQLSTDEITAGLKEALEVGTRLVTDGLGADGGFLNDQAVRIPLPDTLQKVQGVLKPLGMGALGETVEERMNRGAEQAMESAGDVLVSAVQAMTLDDARGILEGPEDAATQYLQRVSGGDIEQQLRPIIDASLKDVGALQALDQMIGQYDSVPFTPDVTVSLTDHATQLAMSGLFSYLAREEKSIRENPAARTTDILKKVFSGL